MEGAAASHNLVRLSKSAVPPAGAVGTRKICPKIESKAMKSILFKNISYFNPRFEVAQGHILVVGDRISRILPAQHPAPGTDVVFEGAGLLAAPGFVNAHFHSQTTLFLGITQQERHTEIEMEAARADLEKRFIDWVDVSGSRPEFAALCRQSYLELVRNGVTATQDSGYGERSVENLREALECVGIRGVLDAYDNIDELFDSVTEFVKYGGHLPEEEDMADELAECAKMLRNLPVRLFTHSLETSSRRDIVLQKFGQSPIALLEEAGVLDERTVLFHVVHADTDDIARIGRCGAHVVHCPVSNARFGVGIAPIADMLEAGINVALGTDWAFANPWENMRLAWYFSNVQERHIPAWRIWQMATRGGARALDLDTGEIAEGRLADIVLLDLSRVELQPLLEQDGFSSTAHNLLMEGDGRLVRDVMVGGKWVLREGQCTLFEEKALTGIYSRISQNLYGAGAVSGDRS